MNSSREHQRQLIDAEIKSLEDTIRALKIRRNALVPISSLPPEVIATIFSFVRLPEHFIMAEEPDQLECLRVAHVCHQWREVALNHPSFWSNINVTTVSPAGVAEMLARSKAVPLHLEARVPIGCWNESRFGTFQKQLQTHTSRICHLTISAEHTHLRKTLEGLVAPAPTLEYLSLSSEGYEPRAIQPRVAIPDNLFNGTTPRISCLELGNCDINWKSSLLKDLRHLEIRAPSEHLNPSLSDWLDMLEGMPRVETLTFHLTSPVFPSSPLSSEDERTITLPCLIHFDISASARDCGLALAHLVLPALNWLSVMAKSSHLEGDDVRRILPHVSRHSHGSQDAQPLQSLFVKSERTHTHIIAWSEPDVDIALRSPIGLFVATRSSRVTFTIINKDWSPGTDVVVFDATMAALPLDGLVTLTAQNRTQLLDQEVWLHQAPRWPLLQRVRLAAPAARGLREMLLEDNWERESPLLPSLTKLILLESALSSRRTVLLCDVLMKRVEQGVPVESLDLNICLGTDRAVQLLNEIVVDVQGPVEGLKERAQRHSNWSSVARGNFVFDDDSEDDEGDIEGDDDEREDWGADEYGSEEVESEWESDDVWIS